ncbi:hypothetical protein [Pseudohongiella sp.]|uniref:Uncharacterized protein n=1 Tax=marine sediment metagenome TaxID=412755 RepID=A0A0F9Z361_9ZZZZ|nr:hypothetical protein [Pseudohongiella sp.]HDZ09188.1 hypothetical protein [Pseudohongiella sp.]
MADYLTFSYSDNLPSRIKERIPEFLKIKESRNPELLLILRLLSGNVILTHNYSDTIIKSRKNYFHSDLSRFRNWGRDFPRLLSEDTTAEDLAIFINNTKFTNNKFYEAILSEISHFLLQERKASHTSAFIFLYRILEKVSYAFPLIYASKTQDFMRSFNQLRNLMTGDSEKKELGFFKKFAVTLYEGDSIAQTSVDIKFDVANDLVRQQMFRSVKEAIDLGILHEDTTEFEKISINYCDMGSFIIHIRNRFFHNQSIVPNNIKSNRIVDSDTFFSFINPVAMYWLSLVLLQIMSFSLSEFQLHRRNAVV